MVDMTDENQTQDAIPTLEEALGAAYDRMQTAEIKADPVTAEVDHPVQATETTKEDRPRAKSGKFLKTDATEQAKAEDGAEDATAAEETPTQDAKQETKSIRISQAPASWTAQAKAKWDSLDPEIKAEAHRIEIATQKAIGKLSAEKKQYEGLEAVLSPRRAELAATYGDEQTGLKTLFALSDFASKDPYGFIKYYAQQRGLDLASLVQQQPTGQRQQVEPTVAPLLQKIQELEGKLSSIEGHQTASINSTIDKSYQSFIENPDNVYFEQVRGDMANLLEANAATDYQDAYEKACWARPDIRELMLLKQREGEDLARQKEIERKAKEARRISATNVASNGVRGTSPSSPRSLEESLEEGWNRAHGAA